MSFESSSCLSCNTKTPLSGTLRKRELEYGIRNGDGDGGCSGASAAVDVHLRLRVGAIRDLILASNPPWSATLWGHALHISWSATILSFFSRSTA